MTAGDRCVDEVLNIVLCQLSHHKDLVSTLSSHSKALPSPRLLSPGIIWHPESLKRLYLDTEQTDPSIILAQRLASILMGSPPCAAIC